MGERLGRERVTERYRRKHSGPQIHYNAAELACTLMLCRAIFSSLPSVFFSAERFFFCSAERFSSLWSMSSLLTFYFLLCQAVASREEKCTVEKKTAWQQCAYTLRISEEHYNCGPMWKKISESVGGSLITG